jgi:hypothetical protein
MIVSHWTHPSSTVPNPALLYNRNEKLVNCLPVNNLSGGLALKSNGAKAKILKTETID